MKVIDRYLDRDLNRKMAAQEERNTALCLTNMELQPDRARFWLDEAKRYAASAALYRSKAAS